MVVEALVIPGMCTQIYLGFHKVRMGHPSDDLDMKGHTFKPPSHISQCFLEGTNSPHACVARGCIR